MTQIACPSCLKVREVSAPKAKNSLCRSCAGKPKAAIHAIPANATIMTCPACKSLYVGRKGKLACSSKCRARLKSNDSYFGGQLFEAKGWKEKICQLCGKLIKGKINVHHVLGHPDTNGPADGHQYLEVLGAGCHEIISLMVMYGWTDETIEESKWYVKAQRTHKLPD